MGPRKTTSPFRSLNCSLKFITFFLLGLFLFLSFFRPVETEDIWWHLKAGQYISENHHVPHYDPFPFSTETTPWILTQWLGSLFYFLIYNAAGLGGLQFSRVFIFLIIVGIFYYYSVKKIPLPLLLIMILSMTFALLTRCHLRPFVFNFIFIQLFLIVLMRYQTTSHFLKLLWLPLLGILWVNIHLGSFMYGFALIGIFLFAAIIRFFGLKSQPNSQQEQQIKIDQIKNLSVVLILYAMTFLLTPYGLDGALHPLKTLFVKDYLHFKQLSTSIAELLPPFHLFSFTYLWFFAYLILGMVAILLPKKKNFTHILLFMCSLFLFLYGRRASIFFVLCSAYIVVESLAQLPLSKNWSSSRYAKRLTTVVYAGVILFLGFNIVTLLNARVFLHGKTFSHVSIRKNEFHPGRAIAVLDKYKITGKVFNDDEYGGYLLWHSYPRLKPFLDTRQINYGPHILYHHVRSKPEEVWPFIEQVFGINIVMLDSSKPPGNTKLLRYILHHPDWRLIFIEGSCVVFVKKGVFKLPEHLTRLKENLTSRDQILSQLDRILPIKPAVVRSPLEELFSPSYLYVENVWTAATYFDLGFKGAGIEAMLEALRIHDDPYSRHVLDVMVEHLE